MSISFDEVPSNARIPGVYIEIDNSQANNASDLQKVLLIGTKNGGDTAINLVSPITTPTTASDRFGTDSQIHKMALAVRNSSVVYTLGLKKYSLSFS